MDYPDSNIDSNLMERISKSDETAFDTLFKKYFHALTFYAFQLVKDSSVSQDIVQDCFVSIWKRRAKMSEVLSIKAYLYVAVKFQCLSYLKSRPNFVEIEDIQDDITIFDSVIIKSEVFRQITVEIEKLPFRQRQVIKYLYLEGKSYYEIAILLNLLPETIRKHKVRGIRQLQVLLFGVNRKPFYRI